MLVQIQDRPGLVRDTSSGAVVNTDVSEYQKHLANREKAKQIRESVQRHEEQINSIQADLGEIKQLLIQLIKQQN